MITLIYYNFGVIWNSFSCVIRRPYKLYAAVQPNDVSHFSAKLNQEISLKTDGHLQQTAWVKILLFAFSFFLSKIDFLKPFFLSFLLH